MRTSRNPGSVAPKQWQQLPVAVGSASCCGSGNVGGDVSGSDGAGSGAQYRTLAMDWHDGWTLVHTLVHTSQQQIPPTALHRHFHTVTKSSLPAGLQLCTVATQRKQQQQQQQPNTHKPGARPNRTTGL